MKTYGKLRCLHEKAFGLLYNVFHTYDRIESEICTNHDNAIIEQTPCDKAPSRTHFQQASANRQTATPLRMCDRQHCFVSHKFLRHTPALIFGHCAQLQLILEELREAILYQIGWFFTHCVNDP